MCSERRQFGRSAGHPTEPLRERASLLESTDAIRGHSRHVNELRPFRGASQLVVVLESFDQPAVPDVQFSEPLVDGLRSRMDSQRLGEEPARFGQVARAPPDRVGLHHERAAAVQFEPALKCRANFALASFLLGLVTPLPIHVPGIASKNVDAVNQVIVWIRLRRAAALIIPAIVRNPRARLVPIDLNSPW